MLEAPHAVPGALETQARVLDETGMRTGGCAGTPLNLLAPEQTAFTAVGIKRSHRDARAFNSPGCERRVDQTQLLEHRILRDIARRFNQ